jgi:hypothetical protein
MKGVIMDESPLNCWTNHHSLVEYNNQWYLFYHQNEYSPKFDKNRSICIDSLFFSADGTIQKVSPTRRGVGVTNASGTIEIDRYSAIAGTGAKIEFMDSTNVFAGWKTVFNQSGAWVRYNAVDFGQKDFTSVQLKVRSETGGALQIRLNGVDGPLLSKVSIPKTKNWTTVEAMLIGFQKGVYNLMVVASDNRPVEIDWVTFK